MLATDSAETRFDFGARKDLYSAYVPFAVAAGAAALWAKKYETTTGTVAPQPDWYNSSSSTGCGLRRWLRRAEFRQLRVGVVIVDRRVHRIAVRRRRAAAVQQLQSAVAVAAAAEEEADHGEVAADRRVGARAAVLVGFVLGYNKIRSADVRVAEALSGIDVELTRRASLIPSLVHTVQTFAVHEKGILDHVTDARAALTSATSGKSVAQRSAAEKELDTALGPVLALGQSYPQLNSSNNFLNLQDNLADTENKLAFARQYYNDAVGHPERADQHHPVDVRRAAGRGGRAGVLPDAAVRRF